MAEFRIHRLREHLRPQFQSAPHTSGTTTVKPRDYREDGAVEATGAYAAWASLRQSERALNVGDLLESGEGQLYICKYVGFEEARWTLPEVQTG
jgi:hypothetical protein